MISCIRGDTMNKRNNLMCVKSIITILLVSALVVQSFVYPDAYAETFRNAVTMVVTFYFVHQNDKKGNKHEDN